MKHVFFKPWIGKNYQTGGIFDKKILVLGESHYCDGCDNCGLQYYPNGCIEDLTNKTVTNIIKGYTDVWTPTFRKFERSLVNEETTNERSGEIWNSVAFFNFLQVDMKRSRKGGTPEDYVEGGKAFLEVINELQPDLIIVWGTSRLYYNMPGVKDGWIGGEELTIDGWRVPNGYYLLKSGKKSRVIAVYHPSAGYSWDWWYKVISSQTKVINQF